MNHFPTISAANLSTNCSKIVHVCQPTSFTIINPVWFYAKLPLFFSLYKYSLNQRHLFSYCKYLCNNWEDPICHVLSSCIKCEFRRDLWEFITITSKTVQIQMKAIYYSQKQFVHFSFPLCLLPLSFLSFLFHLSFIFIFLLLLFMSYFLFFFKYRFILIKILELLLVFHVCKVTSFPRDNRLLYR